MPTETKAAFARRHNVNRATVSKWEGKGLLVLGEDGLVDIEKTEWNLDQRPATYRGGTAHRPIRAVPKDEPDPRERPQGREKSGRSPPPADAPPSAPRPADPDDQDDTFDPDGDDLPTPAAIRRKENYLGLQRKQAYLIRQGELVERVAAEALFFDTARDLRDAWQSWPARIAITMADELKVDARTLTTVLTAHVQQHLAELGEPELDLPVPE